MTTSIVVLGWCNYYARWPGTRSFELPVSYVGGGDTLLVMGIAKGFSELPPPWNLEIHRLNAPFGADWNDYPHTEKLIFYAWGGLLRFLSLGAAANVVSLFAHVSAALAFAWTARRLGRTPPVAHAAALLFAFSPFMMGRALEHVNVSILWHIPLLLLLAVRIASDAHVPSVGWRLCAYALLVATSLQNPYYPPIAFQILALATLRSFIVGRNKVAAFGLKVLAVGVTSFLFGQLNVYLRRWFAGANDAFSGRSLASIQLWALRIPDLFMPLQHVIAPWERFARSHYFEAGNPPTENTTAFQGLVGGALLVALLLRSLYLGLARRFAQIPWEAWLVGYLLLFSLSGGFDYLLGSLGLTWLRSVNRYSVLVLCATLLWGCRALDSVPKPNLRSAAALAVSLWGLVEASGLRPHDYAQRSRAVAQSVASDRRFGSRLERRFRASAMLFELPVMEFPESSPIARMQDCEPFRPFLWTTSLRFTFGTHKGRPRERWQMQVEEMAPVAMVNFLEEHGFDGLLINRRGFADGARWLEESLSALRLSRVESDQKDLVAYKLRRRARWLPIDDAAVRLKAGFPWGWQPDARYLPSQTLVERVAWSSGDATLAIIGIMRPGRRYFVRVPVATNSERTVRAMVGDNAVGSVKLAKGADGRLEFEWTPTADATLVRLRTDAGALPDPSRDGRRVAFGVGKPTVRALSSDE